MKPKRVILCPNPYRDSELKVCKQSRDMLESLGMQTSVCLPFQREGYGEELGIPMRLLQQEIRSADLLIAFGGDGTILHLARTVALHSVPVLGGEPGKSGLYVGAGGQRAGPAAGSGRGPVYRRIPDDAGCVGAAGRTAGVQQHRPE